MEKLIAAGKATLTIAARVLKFSRQAFYQWSRCKLSAREQEEAEICRVIAEIHRDDPEFGYRFIADELTSRGYALSERRVWRLCHQMGVFSAISRRKARTRRVSDG